MVQYSTVVRERGGRVGGGGGRRVFLHLPYALVQASFGSVFTCLGHILKVITLQIEMEPVKDLKLP